MKTSVTFQMSGCHSRSVQPATSVFNLQNQAAAFVEQVLLFQKEEKSSYARKAVEDVLSDFFPRNAVQGFLCLLKTAEENTVLRFACTQLFSSEEVAQQASVSVVIQPNPHSIGSWGNTGRFFIVTKKDEEEEQQLHFTNQASAVYYLMHLIHRLQVADDELTPVSLGRNRETFIQLYHQMYDIADGKLRERVERLLHREVDGMKRVGRQNDLRRDIRKELEKQFVNFGESCKPYAIGANTPLTVPTHLIRFEGEAQRLLEYKFV